jgi:4-hydroxy 2-oxovalerate aldolase
LAAEPDVVSIGLNSTLDLGLDYLLTTREDIYMQAVTEGRNIIVPSSVSKGGRGNVKILNYSSWIEWMNGRTILAVIALKLLKACESKDSPRGL